ncbi:HAD family hydrolase [Acidithiobacillus sp. AMEEHan]|uniref:histidinol-phosphatase n=1 Tax=Acidithiobacillus sp. AMEEHan TaxID=2994951 RepID=UPI0027E4E3E5|nr:HAD family hydrolase [Acidithiobacillus sp. AMEEHan]
MALAIFDLDNTLLAGDSDHAWLEFLSTLGIVDGEELRRANDRYYRDYMNGELDMGDFLRFVLAPMAAHPRRQLDAWHCQYMQERVLPMITDASRALVRKHADAGDTLLIITATNRFVTAPIAVELGVPTLLATEAECDEYGEFTGRSYGIPCFQEGKVERLRQWLGAQGLPWENSLSTAYFYSDSHNDLPLLELVGNPVAVDPDKILLATAQERGWPILSLHGSCHPLT